MNIVSAKREREREREEKRRRRMFISLVCVGVGGKQRRASSCGGETNVLGWVVVVNVMMWNSVREIARRVMLWKAVG